MKKICSLLIVFLQIIVLVSSCSENIGTEPGSDSTPKVLIYQYQAPTNPDNDVSLRFAFNNIVNESYYIVEKTAERNLRIKELGETGYADYIVKNGTKLDSVKKTPIQDVLVKDLSSGNFTITAVAISGNQKVLSSTIFQSLEYEDITKGTYHFAGIKDVTPTKTTQTTLQKCTTNDKLYRLKDVFGKGFSMRFTLMDRIGTDNDNTTFQYARVNTTETPFTHPEYGMVRVRDIGYWQKNDEFISYYPNGLKKDNYCFFTLQYFTTAKSLGYGMDYFVPEK